MADTIHIVCLDAPAPPDYGGAFDLYYKVPALAALGKSVILHYFAYKAGRNAQELEPYCISIYAYPRSSFLKSVRQGLPYIVSSRINRQLIERLNADEHPVLLEGIHCTGIIPYLKKGKKIIIRIHNDEAVYYKNLARTEQSFFKRLYFYYEWKQLEHFQKQLPKNAVYLFVSDKDRQHFQSKYHLANTFFVPCLLPWQAVNALPGQGTYCLYHGNLAVAENKKAAEWLITEVFSRLRVPLVIAGKNAVKLNTSNLPPNIKIVNSPSDEVLSDLLANAHIHLTPSFNATGVKIKLLHALFEGRFCISNPQGVSGSGIETTVSIASTAQETIDLIELLMKKNFTEEDVRMRRQALAIYSNAENAQHISAFL